MKCAFRTHYYHALTLTVTPINPPDNNGVRTVGVSTISSLLPFHLQLREQVNNARIAMSSLWRGLAYSWTENHTDKDGPLLKHRMSLPFPV